MITSISFFFLFSMCEIHVLQPTDFYHSNLFLEHYILVDYFSFSGASNCFLFLFHIFIKSSHFNPALKHMTHPIEISF